MTLGSSLIPYAPAMGMLQNKVPGTAVGSTVRRTHNFDHDQKNSSRTPTALLNIAAAKVPGLDVPEHLVNPAATFERVQQFHRLLFAQRTDCGVHPLQSVGTIFEYVDCF